MLSAAQRRRLWNRVWSARERQLWNRTARPGLSGAIDLPRPGQRFVHAVQVKGWVDGADDVIVAAYVDDERVWQGRPGTARTDVGPTARQFDAIVPVGRLSGRRFPWLRVTVRHARDGEEAAMTLHSLPLRRGQGRQALPRWAYGKVWNRDASNAADAMNAVAGYTSSEEWTRSGRSTADHLVQSLDITTDDEVLEVGCGAARVGVHLASMCRRWTGADVSTNMLAFARTALSNHANVNLVALNGFDLAGIADASMDVVYCTAVFMHLDEWDRFRYVREFHRVLRPGGRVYFDNFDLESPDGWQLFVDMSALDVAVRPPNVSRASTQQELTCYARKAGFSEIGSETGQLWVTVTGVKPTLNLADLP